MKKHSFDPSLVQHVFFDLGKVLIDFDWTNSMKRFAILSKRSIEEVCQFVEDPMHKSFELGTMSPVQYFMSARERMGFEGTFEDFRDIWCDIFTAIPETVNLARQVASRYPCYVISNTNCLHIEFAELKFDFFPIFRSCFYSHKLGLRKPDPGIFREVLKVAGCKPGESLMIDDLEDNVQGARAVGMQVVHATSPQVVCDALRVLLEHKDGPKISLP